MFNKNYIFFLLIFLEILLKNKSYENPAVRLFKKENPRWGFPFYCFGISFSESGFKFKKFSIIITLTVS